PLGVITVNPDLRITSINPWAVKLTGHDAEQALGKFCGDILHGAKCGAECPLRSALSRQNPILSLESTIQNSHGQTIPVRMSTAALMDADGRLLGGVEAFQDISYLKTLEREKDNFISMIAHDMKSSLLVIGGFAHRLLQKGTCANRKNHEDEEKYMEIIRDEALKLETLIEEFLSLSRLKAGRIGLSLSAVSVDKILLELCRANEPRAMDLGLKVDLKFNEDLPMITGDSGQLRRVFSNLMDNAIKFSAKGGTITISSSLEQERVVVTVRDEGPGIAPEDLPFIFDAFHRGKADKHIKGFGLGLASVKAIIDAHGGKVLVESELGYGSTFKVILPRNP
ncbi:MAG: PAS domain-containing sensor histidine kinase, partial [Desulfobacterales bacterium]|nr:PAS domain-containing sensor histidine kinase [Desulfobacterales bacterium]